MIDMKFRTFLCILFAALTLASCRYDDSDLWNAVNDQEERISALEKWQKTVNEQLGSLQGILTATDYVTGIEKVTKEDGTQGYKINFLHAQSITLYFNDQNEVSGDSGSAIGVAQDSNGKWYWTMGGEPLMINGEMVYVENGKEVKVKYNTDGTVTLIVGDDEIIIPEYPLVHPVEKVEEVDGVVVITLADGTTISLPKYAELGSYLQDEYTNVAGGEVTYLIEMPSGYLIKKLDEAPANWSLSLLSTESGATLTVVYPQSGEMTMAFLISDGKSQTVMKNVTFKAGVDEPWSVITYTNEALKIPTGITKVKIIGGATSLTPGIFNTHIAEPLRKNNEIAHIDLSDFIYTAAIPANAFYMNTPAVPETDQNRSIQTILLPVGIANIWDSAFKNCIALKSVTIGATATISGQYSASWFVGCRELESIFVPQAKLETYKGNWNDTLTSYLKPIE